MSYNIQETKDNINCIELAGKFTELTMVSGGKEACGPCPRCGGTDRLRVFAHGFFCRQCRPCDTRKYGDAIDFMTDIMGYPFDRAIEFLGGKWDEQTFEKAKPALQRGTAQRMDRDKWREMFNQFYRDAYANGNHPAALAYLLGRGISQLTAGLFGLGYAHVPLPGTWDATKQEHTQPKQPAIIIPWMNGQGELVGLRYRYLEAHTYTDNDGKERKAVKKSGAFDSDFTGPDMYGLTHNEGDPAYSELLLVEGELNCLSAWQLFNNTRLHVRSFGSEAQPIPAPMVERAATYRNVYIWTDDPAKLKGKLKQLPKAVGVALPSKQDANDLLQTGQLGWVVGLLRFKQCKTKGDYLTLQADLEYSTDPGIKQVVKKIDQALGIHAQV